ncbi:MAG: gamma-glutamyl-gamma-aminobutyrate hydrolase family protein [Actinomycetota bacterium]
MRPLIAVAGRAVPAGRIQGWCNRAVAAPVGYIEALHRGGGDEAILCPVPLDAGEAVDRLAHFDGLLFLGGGDVDPVRYGEDRRAECFGVDEATDAFEIALAQAALHRQMPILAVCRGMQVLNVALGGSLHQHLCPEGPLCHGGPGRQEVSHHPIRLREGSRTARAMGLEEVICVSDHHQALARLGEGLVAVGWAPDGVIEAVELAEGWVVGVQWHPEVTAATEPAQQGLFRALVEQASLG